jgi:hypothetical protein
MSERRSEVGFFPRLWDVDSGALLQQRQRDYQTTVRSITGFLSLKADLDARYAKDLAALTRSYGTAPLLP